MFEKEKIEEKLLKKNDESNNIVPTNKRNSKYFLAEDFLNSRKNSVKSGGNSDKDSRFSLQKRNSDSGINLFVNNSESTNSLENSNSHKNLQIFHRIKFNRLLKKEEEEKNKSSDIDHSTISNISYFFKTHNVSYICNLLSYSVGYESIWRFPYYFINAEGAVFFIPFSLFYFLLGIPLLTIESALGQIFKSSPIGIFSLVKAKININYNYSVMAMKIMTLIIGYIITIYFASLTAQVMHYFLLAFESEVPWVFQLNTDKLYHISFYKTKFINHDSTHQNFDIFRLGEINIHKLISTFITWIIFYLLILTKLDRKKHKYLNRFLSFFPPIMLILIFVICIHPRKGFIKGCIYFLIPNIGNLLHYRPWICGINQAIFLLMLGYGKNYLFSSNITDKDNVYSRSTLTSLIILILGIFCTFFDCIYAGFIAEELNINTINNIPFNNSNIPFLSNLLAIGMLKHYRIISFLFLFSLLIIGFQSQILIIQSFSNFLKKTFPKYLSDTTAPIFLCILSFILCIPFTRFQGQFFLEWIDKYTSFIPLIFIVFYEIIFIMQKFGITLLLEIISNKTNIVLPLYIFYNTKYITPFILMIVMLLSFAYQYENTQYSTLTKIIEWIIFICPFIIFTFFYIKDILSKKETIIKNGDNIIRRGIFAQFPIRTKQRKKTEIASLPVMFNFGKKLNDRKSSFTYGNRNNKYIIYSDDDADNNSSIRQNNDSVYNNDNYNSNFVSESNTRKPTIEMEIINKK